MMDEDGRGEKKWMEVRGEEKARKEEKEKEEDLQEG